MSEPNAAIARVAIRKSALLEFLDSPPRLASSWTDWPEMGGNYVSFSWDKDLPRLLQIADERLKSTYRNAIRGVLHYAEHPAIARCSYDEARGCFTFTTLTLSDNLGDYLFFFSVARGMAAFLRDPEAGFASIQNYFWREWHKATIVMGLGANGYSHFLGQTRDAPAIARHVDEATSIFDGIYADWSKYDVDDPKAPSPPVINDLDRLL
jgi:hypothetical protein